MEKVLFKKIPGIILKAKAQSIILMLSYILIYSKITENKQ